MSLFSLVICSVKSLSTSSSVTPSGIKQSTMKPSIIKPSMLALAVGACLTASFAHSAGLERSTQSVEALFEEGNYAELSYAYVDPDVNGTDNITGAKVGNMLDDYSIEKAIVKVAPTENTALAIMYSQPWGVDTTYPAGNFFNNDLGATEAHVETDAIGLMVAGKPNGGNLTVYGGVEYQKVGGYVRAASALDAKDAKKVATGIALQSNSTTEAQYVDLLTKQATSTLTPAESIKLATIQGTVDALEKPLTNTPTLYRLDFEDDDTLVPMIGLAYEKPEIALRTAVTYRAPAKYSVKGTEKSINNTGIKGVGVIDLGDVVPGNTEVEFPQSVSLDFQTGLSEKYQLLGMVNARWVEWSKFEVAPPFITEAQNGEPLAEYTDDQYTLEVALGKQFTPKLAAEIRASYDSGTGSPLSLLGPYDAVTGLAVGAEYDISKNLTVGGGAQYLWIEGGKVTDSEGNTVMTIDDSNGYALGMKVGYHF